MQETLKFLKTVWPENGLYCIALPYPNGGYDHKLFETIEAAANYALSLEDRDVFFAVGTLIERKVWNPEKVNKKTGEKGKWEVRCASNTLAHKTLIVDVDCGDSKDYPSQAEALQALKTFCTTVGMPAPIINSSGGGLHCYWPFKHEIASSDWERLGEKLKRICMHFKFMTDPSATSDRARVLRVPGTMNCKKTEKRIVRTLKWSDKFGDPEKIEAKFDAIIEANGINLPKQKVISEVPKVFEGVHTLEKQTYDKDLDLIVSRCQQMSRALNSSDDVGYEMRCSVISICKFTQQNNFEPLFKNVRDEVLARQQADQIVLDSITDNPHTCERFEAQYPAGCEGCKHRGKIKSPISLGLMVTNEIKSVEEVREELVVSCEAKDELSFREDSLPSFEGIEEQPWRTGTPRYQLPKNFSFKDDALFVTPAKEDENIFPLKVLEGVFYPFNVYTTPDGTKVIDCYGRNGKDKGQTFIVPAREVADLSALLGTLASRGIMVCSKNAKHLGEYMTSYVTHIQRQIKTTKLYNQLGWHPSKEPEPGCLEEDRDIFVLPHKTITPSGTVDSNVSKKIETVCKEFGYSGTLENWKKVVAAYGLEGYEGYCFGFLSGFGSLLMEMTQYKGAIVSLVGDSGSGKSTVLRAINTLFSRPDNYLTQNDTINAIPRRIASHASIAVTADELTDMDPEKISWLLYSISQGREKHRLDANASEKDNDSRWKLIMVATANRTLSHRMTEFKKDASAEAMRLFEYHIRTDQHKMTKKESEKLFALLENNFGFAGPIFVEYVVKNREEVKELIERVQEVLDSKVNIVTRERYWSAVASVNIAGGIIAKKLGLVDYDMDKMLDWAAEQIKSMRVVVDENKGGPLSSLTDYLADTVAYTLVVGGQGNKAKPFFPIQEPKQKLWNRIENDNALLFVDRAKFRQFVTNNGCDWFTTKKELLRDKIMLNEDRFLTLSKGSEVLKTGQTHAIVIDLNHPMMDGKRILEAIKTEDAAMLKQA